MEDIFMIRSCAICGKNFESKTARKICGDDHYKTCPNCGVSVLWNKTQEFKGCKQCNQRRAVESRKKTMIKRYGAPTTWQSKQLKAKYEATMVERYGTNNARKSEELSKKARATNIIKYGAENPMQNKDVAKKSADTRREKMDEVVEHMKETWRSKYGVDNISQSAEIQQRMTNTFLKKYGVKRAINVPEFRQKMMDTMTERYGVPWYVQSQDYRTGYQGRISTINSKFADKLNNVGINFTQEYRLGFKNYDFYIPSANTLIEIDPSYTHSIIGNHWNKNGLPENYHLEKTKVALEAGIKCIHIFDWDDWDKVLQLIKPRQSIYARQCKIWKIFPQETNTFLNSYHIQGSCKGQSISLGLVKDDKLLMVMTFGTPRYNSNYSAEILRFATLPGYRVIGGASRLFKYFIDTYEVSSIISYCDLAKFEGSVYEKIGMTYDKYTQPQEIWSKEDKKITANLLRQRGFDQLFGTNFGKGVSNDMLMLEHGWLPVYDCGQAVYTYGDKIHHIRSKQSDMKSKGMLPKICKFCRKSFIPNSNHQVYCKGPHIRTCPICGKAYEETNVDNLKKPPKACSNACRIESIKRKKQRNKHI